jgi:hypothetical protein
MSESKKIPAQEAAKRIMEHMLPYKDSDNNSYIAKKEYPAICFKLTNSEESIKIIRSIAKTLNIPLNKNRLLEILDEIDSCCYDDGKPIEINNRVAAYKDGYIYHLSNNKYLNVSSNGTNLINSPPEGVYFCRRAGFQDMDIRESSNKTFVSLLARFNCPKDEKLLLLAWLIYTVSTPKSELKPYPILKIQAPAGSGKSVLSGKLIRGLLDANDNEMINMQRNPKDIAISAQNGHVVIYDNLRLISPDVSDVLCQVSTGGSLSSRTLYSNNAESTIKMRSALVLNGIHDYATESDLISRCVTIRLKPLVDSQRQSEAELSRQLEIELPEYIHLLHRLAAKILKTQDSVTVTYKSRMADFALYVAGLEKVIGIPEGRLQDAYKHNVEQSTIAGVIDDSLYDSLMRFAQQYSKNSPWQGTPKELLNSLTLSNQSSSDMPKNAAAMSRRIPMLQSALTSNGVHIIRGRATDRYFQVWSENTVETDEATESKPDNSTVSSTETSFL